MYIPVTFHISLDKKGSIDINSEMRNIKLSDKKFSAVIIKMAP